jgi:glycine cleavage system H protein
MTVTLALLTFLFFALLDYVLHHRKAGATAAEPSIAGATEAEPATVPEPVFVAGYELPDGLHYHRGHTWTRVLSDDVAVVGIDDFANRLVGRVTDVRPPRKGAWLRQGVESARLRAGERETEIVTPIEGEVIAVNDALRDDPEAVNADPYGRGWLFKVRAANLGANLRNLMDGSMAHRWTEDAREQLEVRLMALSGSVLQDGGEPAPDFADHLEPDEWHHLTRTFLLT